MSLTIVQQLQPSGFPAALLSLFKSTPWRPPDAPPRPAAAPRALGGGAVVASFFAIDKVHDKKTRPGRTIK